MSANLFIPQFLMIFYPIQYLNTIQSINDFLYFIQQINLIHRIEAIFPIKDEA